MKINERLLDIDVVQNSRLPLIDLFIRRTAVVTSTPEHIVEKIVKDQWKNANKKTQPNDPVGEIDFCNLGLFYISKSKASKRIARLEKFNADLEGKPEESRVKNTSKSLVFQKNIETIQSIRTKTKEQHENERESYHGGNQEQCICERGSGEDSQRKV